VWSAHNLRPDLALLHCVTAHLTALSSVNLRAMHTLRSHFPGVSVGFSHHTIGIDAAVTVVVAVAVIFLIDLYHRQELLQLPRPRFVCGFARSTGIEKSNE